MDIFLRVTCKGALFVFEERFIGNSATSVCTYNEQMALSCSYEVMMKDDVIRSRLHVVAMLFSWDVDAVLDVGARDRQYAQYLGLSGYKKRIVSCEPLSEVCAKLLANSQNDSLWDAMQITIRMSRQSAFSSMLKQLPLMTEFAADAMNEVGKEQSHCTHLIPSTRRRIGFTGQRKCS
jgi:hypothetical protein